MKKTKLSGQVIVDGYSFMGFKALCSLEMISKPGVHVILPNYSIVPLREMNLRANRLFRYLLLESHGYFLHIVEHMLGLIYILGLDGILIDPRNFRIPYDGTAKVFWEAIRPMYLEKGEMKWVTSLRPIEVIGTGGQFIKFFPAENKQRILKCAIGVDYSGVGAMTLVVNTENMTKCYNEIFSARSLMRNRIFLLAARFAKKMGWPHSINTWIDLNKNGNNTSLLDELCFHRFVDMLGSFLFLCPPGGRIAGTVIASRASHTLDIEFVRKAKKEIWIEV